MSARIASRGYGNERLAVRRRRRRYRSFLALTVLFFVLLGIGIYGLWQPAVRISRVEVHGADPSLAAIAETAMRGSYFGIIPRDSTFFFPEARIRTDILSTYTGVAAVSISRNGFTGLSIKVDDRTPVARWCGSSSATTSPASTPLSEASLTASGDCYLFDASGFLYATATEPFSPAGPASSSSPPEPNPDQTLTPFVLFDALPNASSGPVGETLRDADRIPAIFDFARQVGSLGPAVKTIVIRGDEADFFLTAPAQGLSGPRITYLLGDEQNALNALVSAKGQLNLSDPTLEYVDLRFSGKIYFKRNQK